MIKRNFNQDSYEQAFSQSAIKAPVFHQGFLRNLSKERIQLFYSKHGLLFLSIFNLMGVLALFIFIISQIHHLDQLMAEGHSKVARIEDSVKLLRNESEKIKHQSSLQSAPSPEPELIIADLNIRYLGLMHEGHLPKALIEMDEVTSFFGKGQLINGHWLIKSFDQSRIVLESIKGQQMTFPLE